MNAKQFVKAHSDFKFFTSIWGTLFSMCLVGLVWLTPCGEVFVNFTTFFAILSMIGVVLSLLLWTIALIGYFTVLGQDYWSDKDKALIANYCKFNATFWIRFMLTSAFVLSLVFHGFIYCAIVFAILYSFGIVLIGLYKVIAFGVLEKRLEAQK